MLAASLDSYDGSAGVLVDTNIWVDCIDEASTWHNWAVEQLQLCSEKSLHSWSCSTAQLCQVLASSMQSTQMLVSTRTPALPS